MIVVLVMIMVMRHTALLRLSRTHKMAVTPFGLRMGHRTCPWPFYVIQRVSEGQRDG